ncbi:hypothetical protein BROC_01321 [Candidatus Brocadiaceae bacterium]|nr:hypothetical protein BROC_01321 [Candidatus Brocadiaceae bacterium]
MDEEYFEFNFANQSAVSSETALKNFNTEFAAFGIGASAGLAASIASAATVGDMILSTIGLGGALAGAVFLFTQVSDGMKDHTGPIRDKIYSVSDQSRIITRGNFSKTIFTSNFLSFMMLYGHELRLFPPSNFSRVYQSILSNYVSVQLTT